MNRLNRLALLTMITTMPLLTTACASLSGLAKPEIQSIRPSIQGLDFQGINLAFDVDVKNPYPTALSSPLFKYGMDIQNTHFFSSEKSVNVSLPARKTGTVTLPMRLAYADLWKAYQGLSGAREVDYTLNGALVLPVAGQKLELPLSHAGKFPVLQLPTVSIVKMNAPEMSLTKALVSLDAEVANPNIFDIGIANLGYALNLGGIKLGDLVATTGGQVASGKSGKLTLKGELSAMDAVRQLIGGQGISAARIAPIGAIQTPYGPVKIPDTRF